MGRRGDEDETTTCVVGFLAGSVAWLCHRPATVTRGATADLRFSGVSAFPILTLAVCVVGVGIANEAGWAWSSKYQG